MSLAIRCPNQQCGRLVRVSTELRGQRIACPACGAGLRIPSARKGPAEHAPANLDDTPPDLEAIPDDVVTPPADTVSSLRDVDETVADKAAAATSALIPILKLALVFAFLGGLVWVSTQYIFPKLWAKKSISSGAIEELTQDEEEAKRREAERKARQSPLDEPTKSTITSAIDRGDVVEARRLIQKLQKDGTTSEEELKSIDVAFQSALARRLTSDHEKLDALISEKKWDDAGSLLAAIRDMDPTAQASERFRDADNRLKSGRVGDRLEEAARLWDREDYDAALEVLNLARNIDKSDRRIEDRRREYARAMQSGVFFKVAGGVEADVFLDGRKIGTTRRTIWKLPPHKRLSFVLTAPNHVPREVREMLAPDIAKSVQVVLAPSVPDALWAAHLLKDDSAKWLVCAAIGGEDGATRTFAAEMESKTRAIKPNEKKKSLWLLTRKDGQEVHAIEYSTLGNTIRYVEVDTGETVKCTREDVTQVRKLTDEQAAQRLMGGLAKRAAAQPEPCAALRQIADFVEMFPNEMNSLLGAHGDAIRQWAGQVADMQSCAPGSGRRSELQPVKRVAAELAAWRAVKAKPPETLLQQSKSAP